MSEVATVPYWLDLAGAPARRPPLAGTVDADLLVVGGGLTGLWTALQAAEEGKSVVLLEGERLAFGASGRNGGFCDASLTHGLGNGLQRWPGELETLERLGRENLEAIEATVRAHGIDCGWEPTGTIAVATAEHQLPWLEEEAEAMRRFGWEAELLDRDGVRARGQLADVHRRPALARRVRARRSRAPVLGARDRGRVGRREIHESTTVSSLAAEGDGVRAVCPGGAVRARRVLLATAAFPPLVRAIRRYVVPVYDYVLVTEPLTEAQRDAIGWRGREGLSDVTNQFHYYRQTDDHRILWGGYDAVYDFGGRVTPERDGRPATFSLLAEHFLATFPQLGAIGFSHRWGGAIDTCSRFSALWGKALGGRAVYVVGFTGLGVGASRFGARVGLDLLDGLDTERTRLEMVRKRPIPFPPEPVRWAGITLTRRALARADRARGPPRPVAADARSARPRLRFLTVGSGAS